MSVGVTARPSSAEGLAAQALDAHRRRERNRARLRILRRLGLLAALIFAWELFGRSVSPVFFPTFTATIAVWLELVQTGVLWQRVLESLGTMLVGFALALAVAIPIGMAMGRYRTADAVLQMYMAALLAVPMVAIFPFVIVILGIRITAEVGIVFLFVFVYVIVTTAAGIRATSRELLEMGRSFLLGERELFRWVMLPSAAPLIMAGVRLGFGRAVTGMLLAELLLTSRGFGFLLNEASAGFDTAQTFATVLTLLMLAVLGAGTIQALDRRINAWRPELHR